MGGIDPTAFTRSDIGAAQAYTADDGDETPAPNSLASGSESGVVATHTAIDSVGNTSAQSTTAHYNSEIGQQLNTLAAGGAAQTRSGITNTEFSKLSDPNFKNQYGNALQEIGNTKGAAAEEQTFQDLLGTETDQLREKAQPGSTAGNHGIVSMSDNTATENEGYADSQLQQKAFQLAADVHAGTPEAGAYQSKANQFDNHDTLYATTEDHVAALNKDATGQRQFFTQHFTDLFDSINEH